MGTAWLSAVTIAQFDKHAPDDIDADMGSKDIKALLSADKVFAKHLA